MGLKAVFALMTMSFAVAGCNGWQAEGTRIVVVTPVDSHGNKLPDWSVDDKTSSGSIDCSSGAPSPFDVTHGVRFCGATADDGAACWPKGDDEVYCLVDAQKETLKLVDASGLYKPVQPRTNPPSPALLVLDNGTVCQTRVGGAWPSRPDGTSPTHGCGVDTGEFQAVWATPGTEGGIHTDADAWTVDVGNDSDPLITRRVATAYFVGMG